MTLRKKEEKLPRSLRQQQQQCFLPLKEILFDYFFERRKASKYKRVINRAQCRLRLLKSKKSAMAKYLREDTAELLRIGDDHQLIFKKVEQLYIEENLMEIYQLLDNFCEFVALNCIRTQRDCCFPDDDGVNEAISSLIFASARLCDLPELMSLRELFVKQYGHQFITIAVELLPGNHVNRQLREMICKKSVPEDAKNRLLDDIIKHCFSRPGKLALGYNLYSPPPQSHPKNYGIQITEGMMFRECNDDDEGKNTFSFLTPPKSPDTVIVYDIEEYQYPMEEDNYNQDRRVFVFRPASPSLVFEEYLHHPAILSSKNEVMEEKEAIERWYSPNSSPSISPGQKMNMKSITLSEVPAATNEIPELMTLLDYPSSLVKDNNQQWSLQYRHVHPKMPDYDDIVAKFTALKKAHEGNNAERKLI